MILPNLKLRLFSNRRAKYLGMDSYEKCMNKEHFLNYPYDVDYSYNSRGFRGPEWPSEIDNVYWCVGDSFTAGIGSPYNHTWHAVLSDRLKITTVNVSMDGSSNMWMARKILNILEVKPKHIIVQWSFIHRREADTKYDDERRTLWYSTDTTVEEDIKNTIDCINLVEANKENTNIIHTFIPNCAPESHQLQFKELIEKMNINVVWFEQIDYARDYFHYDVQTSSSLAEKLIQSKYINI